MCATTRSPSIVNGTKTALPSTRPTPFPPNAMSSITSSTSRGIGRCSQTRRLASKEECRIPREVLQQRPDALQVGIGLGDGAEARIHLKADLQMLLRVPRVAEKCFVATHVVVINRLPPQRRWTF